MRHSGPMVRKIVIFLSVCQFGEYVKLIIPLQVGISQFIRRLRLILSILWYWFWIIWWESPLKIISKCCVVMNTRTSISLFPDLPKKPHGSLRLRRFKEKDEGLNNRTVPPPAIELVKTLNTIAKQYPFCVRYKGKDGELLWVGQIPKPIVIKIYGGISFSI